MGETVEDAAASSKAKPTILVPPRGPMEFLLTNGPGFSPGPMTLVSSFFSEQGPFSFSQLLAGAMASPIAAKPSFVLANDSGKEEKEGVFSDDGTKSEIGGGYNKWNRPMNLVVAQPQQQLQLESLNQLIMVPPGLSPSGLLNSPGFLSPLQSPFGMSHQQALAHVTAQAALSQSFMQMQSEFQHSSSTATAEELANHLSSAPSDTLRQHTNALPTEPEISKTELSEVSESDRKTAYLASDKPASDGYNWRKYGQKHVKGTEFPRSYYKCTHLNCPVKKKVERSFDGHISDITYKGQHNHDLPQPNKRGKDGNGLDRTINSQMKPVFASQSQTEADRLNEAISVHSESANFQATTQESFGHPQVTSHNDEMEDTAVVVNDEDEDEPIAKRRSMPASSHQTVTESKTVLQTRSQVDLLNDGYKWRKYGQKVVKGNTHPRSYYRCTYAGCNVRKHVERASADPKTVITTYEGQHNHEIPTGRYANASAQQSKTQKLVSKNSSLNKEMDYGNKDQIPLTLQLKEEQIAA